MKRLMFSAVMVLSLLASHNALAGWPKPLAEIFWLDQEDGKPVPGSGIMVEGGAPGWGEVEKAIAAVNHVVDPHISPEYLLWRQGAIAIMAPAHYLTSQELGERMKAYRESHANETPEQAAARKVAEKKEADAYFATQKPWLQLIQVARELPNGNSTPEDNCMSTALGDGKYTGCGDVFQGGLQEDEIACYNNKNYIRCHIDCLVKIRGKKMDYTPGSCKEPAAP